jgi:hypothetical protein
VYNVSGGWVTRVCVKYPSLVALCMSVVASAQSPTTVPPQTKASDASNTSPALVWVGIGPSYTGSRWGATAAMAFRVSNTINSWTAYDLTWTKTLVPATMTSTGFAFDVMHFKRGKWSGHVHLLTTAGVVSTQATTPVTTSTPAGYSFSATGGAHPVLIYDSKFGKLVLGGGYRGSTGQVSRVYNVTLGYSFGK